ncbi:hypothetical protein [Paracoccus sp. SCN 68-21]|uniref:hypothetical protein n=1 Tax=Paracoccus sp. SCN 68-21 TaxID=1660154 RepID=UPI00086BEF5D|nr:hypothetical protein [Paracoccus sp. SCN 68-21]ODT60921.1 MAG: hypothetical protein ABS73_03505 [Paracoccus sp. SCN 68-21]
MTAQRAPEPQPCRTRLAARRGVPLSLVALLSLTACGSRMTDDILPGGIPARTDLHQASGLPPASVRTVARRDFGWRGIYHAESRAAVALCGLERRAPLRIVQQPRLDPFADPGARIFDIYCA